MLDMKETVQDLPQSRKAYSRIKEHLTDYKYIYIEEQSYQHCKYI